MSMTREAIQKVEEFLQRGQRLQAVQYLKSHYGFSLEESKILVDTFEGKGPGPEIRSHRGEVDADTKAQVTALLDRGNRFDAIQFIKKKLNLNLKGAKSLVEEIENDMGPRARHVQRGVGLALKIVLGTFVGVGIVFIVVAAWLFLSQAEMTGNSETVVGRVVKLQSNGNSDGKAPVIEYEWNNRTWLHASRVYTSPPAYVLNEEIPMLINRENPAEVVIDTFTDRWAGVLIFGLLGSVFVLIPAVAFLLIRR